MTFPFPMGNHLPVPLATLSWRTPTTTSTADVTGTGANYSFAAVDIGTAGATRVVVLGIGYKAASSVTLSSVTIGGISAAAIIQESGISNKIIEFWSAVVPTGTTATIVITPGAVLVSHIAVSVWALVPSSSTPVSSSSNASASTAALAVTNVAIRSGGAVTAMAFSSDATITFTESWGGIDTPTERDDAHLEATSTYAVCDFLTTETGTKTFTVTPSSTVAVSAAAVSWR